jgi:hypothetical protein
MQVKTDGCDITSSQSKLYFDKAFLHTWHWMQPCWKGIRGEGGNGGLTVVD